MSNAEQLSLFSEEELKNIDYLEELRKQPAYNKTEEANLFSDSYQEEVNKALLEENKQAELLSKENNNIVREKFKAMAKAEDEQAEILSKENNDIVRAKFKEMSDVDRSNRISYILRNGKQPIPDSPTAALAASESADAESLMGEIIEDEIPEKTPLSAEEGTTVSESKKGQALIKKKIRPLEPKFKGHAADAPIQEKLNVPFKQLRADKKLHGMKPKTNALGKFTKFGKIALGVGVLGTVIGTMISSGGHQTNAQLYGQQPVDQ